VAFGLEFTIILNLKTHVFNKDKVSFLCWNCNLAPVQVKKYKISFSAVQHWGGFQFSNSCFTKSLVFI